MSEEIKLRPAPTMLPEPVKLPEKQKARLKNWAHYPSGGGPFYREFPHLTGNVYDHPRLLDGEFVGTSRLRWVDFALKVAETNNTIYILEGPPAT